MEELKYLAPKIGSLYFVGFTRDVVDEMPTDDAWDRLAEKVEALVFNPMREKTKLLGLSSMRRNSLEIRDVFYSRDRLMVGCFLQSMSGSLVNKSKKYIHKMKEINKFAFEKISEISEGGEFSVCSNLIQSGVLDGVSFCILRKSINLREGTLHKPLQLEKC